APGPVEHSPPTHATRHPQACHRRRQPTRHRNNDTRVRIERLLDRRLLFARFLRIGNSPANEHNISHGITVATQVSPTSSSGTSCSRTISAASPANRQQSVGSLWRGSL